jgi:hypothetical protein
MMKKTMLGVGLAVTVLCGCATADKLFDSAQTAAEAGPAVIEDARSLGDKLGDLWGSFVAIWKPTTNAAPVVK